MTPTREFYWNISGIWLMSSKPLQQAGVGFAVLGQEERCSGDPARRIGNEYLFQKLARRNIELLQSRKVKKIVTSCSHCFNTLKNEYPRFGGAFEVQHHSQFLAELLGTTATGPGSEASEQ